MNKYINIHTHRNCGSDTICITNLNADGLDDYNLENDRYYSIGLHPWNINDKTENIFENKIQRNSINTKIIAIGETGLDRVIETSFELQEKIFKQHIILSESNKLPIIIHCVKAYNDLVRIRKTTNSSQPWILHGYRGNLDITLQLLKQDFYFSFGNFLQGMNKKLLHILQHIPIEKIFFETDDEEKEVSEYYKLYCDLQNLELNTLKMLIAKNFTRCFGFEHC